MILGTPPGWSKGSAELLKQFLETQTGLLFLANLASARPSLSPDSDISAVALQAKFVAGYELAIERISSLTEPPIEDKDTGEETYPNLDDESKWKDGLTPS